MANGTFLRGEVYWVSLDSSVGSELKTGRPAVIVSGNSLNEKLDSVVVAFLSTGSFPAPTHPSVYSPEGIKSRVLCEQVRTIDKTRLVKHEFTVAESDMIRVTGALACTMCIPTTMTEKPVYEKKIADLETEIAVLKRMYDKAVDKVVEARLEADIAERMKAEPVVEEEEETIPEAPAVEFEETPVLVDINTCSADDLKKCGCTLSVANTLISNRPYKVLDEIRGLPGITSVAYGLLKVKLCCIPVKEEKPEPKPEPEVEVEKVNINTATAKEISKKLDMPMNDAYAITGYRNRNGSFVELEELLEIPRITKLKFEKYKDRMTIGEPQAAETPEPETEIIEEVADENEKVNVNTANIYELMGAGFGKSEAGRIVRWVKSYGKFKSLDDLVKVDGVTGKLLRKIRDNLEV